MLERLKQYIDYKGISISAFEKSIGMSNASFGKSLKNHGTIGANKLETILSVYSDLNPVWLLTGEGKMLKDNIGHTQIGDVNTIDNSPINISHGDLIAQLQLENKLLKERLKDKDEIINLLKTK